MRRKAWALVGLVLLVGVIVWLVATIDNGEVATQGDFPYAAYFPKVQCGGVLVAKDWVLTAEHCKATAKNVVYINRNDMNTNAGSVARVEAVKPVAASMNVSSGIPDLVLVQLTCRPKGKPLALDRTASWQRVEKPTLLIAGWSGSYQLRYGLVSPRTNGECAAIYKTFDASNEFCTGQRWWPLPLQGAASGDSGGPVVYGRGEAAVLVGILQAGTFPTPNLSALIYASAREVRLSTPDVPSIPPCS